VRVSHDLTSGNPDGGPARPTRVTPRAALLVLPLLAPVLALGACGESAGEAGADSSPSPTASSVRPTVTPTTAPSAPPSTPSDARKPLTVTGVVIGDDPRCLDVRADTGVVWTLVGDPVAGLATGLTKGDRVTATGFVPVGTPTEVCGGEQLRVDKLTR
jgi:hypothetical protein